MDRYESKPVVLARIPSVRTSRASGPPESAPASRGRLLSQAFSFKVLASVAVLLVAMAIAPGLFKRQEAAAPNATTAEAWHPSVPATSPDTAPETSLASHFDASSQKTLPSSAASEIARDEQTNRQKIDENRTDTADVTPASASIDEPLMSVWPNPSQPLSAPAEAAARQPRVDVNHSMAIRPTDRAY